jgi:hypothetical protein
VGFSVGLCASSAATISATSCRLAACICSRHTRACHGYHNFGWLITWLDTCKLV